MVFQELPNMSTPNLMETIDQQNQQKTVNIVFVFLIIFNYHLMIYWDIL